MKAKLYSNIKNTCTVNLNNNWKYSSIQLDTKYTIYESYSNIGIKYGIATMYITVKNNTGKTIEFDMYINSYAELGYDYTHVYNLDDSSSEYDSTINLNANPLDGFATAWKKVHYTIPIGTHEIKISYKKDENVNANSDKGYVAIPTQLINNYYIVEDVDGYITKDAVDEVISSQNIRKSIYRIEILEDEDDIGNYCIDNDAFYGFSELTAVIIPDKLDGIYENAFKDCTKLAVVTRDETEENTININALYANAFENTAIKKLVAKNLKVFDAGILCCEYEIVIDNDTYYTTHNGYGIRNSVIMERAGNAIKGIRLTTPVAGSGINAFLDTQSNYVKSLCFGIIENHNLQYVRFDTATILGENALNKLAVENVISPSISCIENDAFYSCSSLKTIDFSNVRTINAWHPLFIGCHTLACVNMPQLSSIPTVAFGGDTDIHYVKFENVKSIESYAFSYLDSTIGWYANNTLNIAIFPNVENVSDHAFENCTTLTYVELEKVKQIGTSAFANCQNLYRVNIPNTCFGLSDDALDNSAINVLMLSALDHVPQIEHRLFTTSMPDLSIIVADDMLDEFNNDQVWKKYASQIYSITTYRNTINHIADDTLGKSIFEYYDGSTYLYDSTKTLDQNFELHEKSKNELVKVIYNSDMLQNNVSLSDLLCLRKIQFATELTGNNSQALRFCNLSSLTDIDVTIDSYCLSAGAFSDCPSLTAATIQFGDNIDFESSQYEQLSGLFKNCKNLKTFKSTDGIHFGKEWFSHCYSLKNILTLDEVNSLLFTASERTFEDCMSLEQLNQDYQATIHAGQYLNCINLSTIGYNKISESNIDLSAFANCFNFSTSDIKNTTISSHAFSNCYSIYDISLSNMALDVSAFCNCYGLNHATLYNLTYVPTLDHSGSVKSFCNCINLSAVEIAGESNIFSSNCIDVAGVTDYCTELSIYEMQSFAATLATYDGKNDHLRDLYLGKELNRLGHITNTQGFSKLDCYSFENCINLKTVHALDSDVVLKVGTAAFRNCTSLENIDDRITLTEYIGDEAFMYTNLLSVSIGGIDDDGIPACANTDIYARAFYGCSKLKQIIFNDFVSFKPAMRIYKHGTKTYIDYLSYADNIFANCISLEQIVDNTSIYIQSIYGEYYPDIDTTRSFIYDNIFLPIGLFINCFSLSTDLYFTNPNVAFMTDIFYSKYGTFEGCSSLTHVSFPSSNFAGSHFKYVDNFNNTHILSGIPTNTFKNCYNLSCCEIPYALTVDNYAFANCYALKQLFKDGVDDMDLYCVKRINDGAFMNCHQLTSINTRWCTYVGLSAFKNCDNLKQANLSFYDNVGHDNNGIIDYYRVIIDDSAFENCITLYDVWTPFAKYIGNKAFKNTNLYNFFNYEDNCYANIMSTAFENTGIGYVQFRTPEAVTLMDIKNTSDNNFYGMSDNTNIIASWWPRNGDSQFNIGQLKNLTYIPDEYYLRTSAEKWHSVSAWVHLGIAKDALPYLSGMFMTNSSISADYQDYVNYLDLLDMRNKSIHERIGHDAPMWKYDPDYDSYSMDELLKEHARARYTHKDGMLYDRYDTITQIEQNMTTVKTIYSLSESGLAE